MRAAMIAVLACLAHPALAEDQATAFVEGNVLGSLYHELGHAMIDVLQLPVLGREEDAADALAIVLAHNLWQEDQARSVATATALYYWYASVGGEEPVSWGVHGTDEQRFYTTVCLFYGADPDNRADFARENELPEDRASGCADEFKLADESWWGLLDDVVVEDGDPPGNSFVFKGGDGPIAELLAAEVETLNTWFKLPITVPVELAECQEANAFYDPELKVITICTEYVAFFEEQAAEEGL